MGRSSYRSFLGDRLYGTGAVMFDLGQVKRDLRRDEGFRARPYKDTVGKLTVGYGRNLDDVGLSEQEAEILLANDIANVCSELDRHLPWWRNLSGVRQGVVLNMCFNMGIKKLLAFKNTLAAMERGDYEAAAQGMENSRWYGQVKGRAVRLVKEMRDG